MIDVKKLRPAYRVVTRTGCRLSWIEISFGALFIVLGLLSIGFPAHAEATLVSPLNKGAVYLPMISSDAAPVTSREKTCELNYQETAVLNLMQEHPEQGRNQIHCNSTLSQVARARAEDMAKRGYFDHVNPDGHGPNYLVTQAGFRLPDWYSDSNTANNIESIGAGFRSPLEIWQAWLDSKYHRIHVLGTDKFYAGQEQVGIGYYADPNSMYHEYWVVITAPTETQ
jgi:uncharacterized protein YkwD